MAINNKPIFTGQPAITVTQITSTNTTNTYTIFPGGTASTPSSSTEGWYVQKVRIKQYTTDGASTSTTATVLRLYISPDSGSTNYQFDEINLPAISLGTTVSTPNYEIPVNMTLPSGYYITAKYDSTPGAGTIATYITVLGGTYAAQ